MMSIAETVCIQTQKAMLSQYAKEHGFSNCEFFVDDGYSGTNFNRPDFQRMLGLVEVGMVAVICVVYPAGALLSANRLLYRSRFPENHTRFIAINDNVDSEKGDNEFAPFKNIINEWYAKL
ncbi:MAG: recombinase family protein [Merdibacter sp.]